MTTSSCLATAWCHSNIHQCSAFCTGDRQLLRKRPNNYFWLKQHEYLADMPLFSVHHSSSLCGPFNPTRGWQSSSVPSSKKNTHRHSLISPVRLSSPHPNSRSCRSPLLKWRVTARNSKNKQRVKWKLSSHRLEKHNIRGVCVCACVCKK